VDFIATFSSAEMSFFSIVNVILLTLFDKSRLSTTFCVVFVVLCYLLFVFVLLLISVPMCVVMCVYSWCCVLVLFPLSAAFWWHFVNAC